MEMLDIFHPIKAELLNPKQYVQSLIEQACNCGLLSDKELSKLQSDLLFILSEQTDKWSRGESSSIPTAKAQDIMTSILFVIGLQLKSYQTPEQAVDRLKSEPLKVLFEKGMKLVHRKMAVCCSRDYRSVPLNIFEPVILSALGLVIQERTPIRLDLTENDILLLYQRFSTQSENTIKECLKKALSRLSKEMDLPKVSIQYASLCIPKLTITILNAVKMQTLDKVFLIPAYPEQEPQIILSYGERMSDREYQKLVERILQKDTGEEKIALILNEVHSLADLLDILSDTELYAGNDLATSDERIIDIAMRYGYDSPDSFTKAFSRFHGVTPTATRKNKVMLKSFAPLTIKLSFEGGYLMDYRIEKKDAFTVIANTKTFTYEEAKDDIPQFWKEHFKAGKGKNVMGVYGINIDEKMGKDTFEYLIADPYKEGAEVLEGFITRTIPELTWAVFPCVGAMPDALQIVNKKIFTEWLPALKDYEFAAGYCVEMYDEPTKYMNGTKDEKYYCEIWIPVKQK